MRRALLLGAGLLAAAALGAVLAAQIGSATPARLRPMAGDQRRGGAGTAPPEALLRELVLLDRELASLISDWQDGKIGSGPHREFSARVKAIELLKRKIVKEYFDGPTYGSVTFSEVFDQLDCLDSRLYLALGYDLTESLFRKHVPDFLETGKKCKQKLENDLRAAATTTTPPPTTTTSPKQPPSKTIGKAYKGAIDNGVYLASGQGSHLRLTVNGRAAQITYGTNFRYVCKAAPPKSPSAYSFDFHPGWALHPISPTGGFKITLFHTELDAQFTGPTTVRGVFLLDRDAKVQGQCTGDHTWIATLGGNGPATISGPLALGAHHVIGPVTAGEATIRDALFATWLKSKGYAQDPKNPMRATDAKGGVAVFDRDDRRWNDAKTGVRISPPGTDPGVIAYAFYWVDLLPKNYGLTDAYHAKRYDGATAVFDTKKLQWIDPSTGAALSRSGR